MKRLILASSCLIALTGCGLAQQAQMRESMQKLQPAIEQCRSQYPSSRAQQSDCVTVAEDTYMRPYYRYGDLLSLMQTQRKVLAVAIDDGQMSVDQGNLQLAKAKAELTQQQFERDNAAGLVSAQQRAASAQMLGASAAILQTNRPATTSCTRFGTNVTCNSY
jgi:hypothetical protein